jgi:hypothetical protein
MPGRLRFASRILVVAWLGLFSLMDAEAFARLVVCVGTDGHVAVETSSDGDCCRPGDEADRAFAFAAPEGGHCGECKDVRIANPGPDVPLVGRAVPAPDEAKPVLALLPFPDEVAVPRIPNRAAPIAPSIPELTSPPLRSIVLLI